MIDLYTPQSSLRDVGRIGQARWIAALTTRGVADPSRPVNLYHAYAPSLGINPDLALAQACEETAWFTSRRWTAQRNPCGLGIITDETPGVVFSTQKDGILAHLQHLCCYAYDADTCPVVRTEMRDFRHSFHDGNPAISHLQDSTREWATSPGYVARILSIANSLLPQEQPTMSVPKPPVDTSHPSPNRNGYASTHEARCVVWHITDGTNSLGWLTNPASGASSNYLIARNGTIYELVPPTESAWANGKANKPDLSNPIVAQAIKEKRNLNTVSISIEHEGKTSAGAGGSLTTQQADATVALTAWLCDRFGIAPDQTHILGHYEIDSVDRRNCPGFSAQEWNRWVLRVKDAVAPLPQPAQEGSIRAYINDRGETVVEINYGGQAKQLLGVNIQDVGVSVTGTDDATYDRSVQANVFQPWVKRGN